MVYDLLGIAYIAPTWDDSHHSPHGCHGPRSVVPLWGADAWDLGGFLRWSLAWSGDHLLSGGAGRQHRGPEAKMMAEPHWSLVKGTIFSDKPKLADFGPVGRFFLGGMWKKTKTHFDLLQELQNPHTFGWWAHTWFHFAAYLGWLSKLTLIFFSVA